MRSRRAKNSMQASIEELYAISARAGIGGTANLPAEQAAQLARIGTDYYVNPTTGNDSNPGTALSPWKTLAKVQSWMAKLTMTHVVSVHLSAGTFNENLIVDWNTPGEEEDATEVEFLGTRTNLYAGSAQAGTLPWVPGIVGSGGNYGVLVDAGVLTGAWSTSGLVGKHFSMTTGANAGQVGVIIAEVPGNPTWAYYLPTQTANAVPVNGMPTVGDTYEVYDTTLINGRFEPGPMSCVYLQDISVDATAIGGNVVEATSGGVLSTFGCHFKGANCTVRNGYWVSIACYFELPNTPLTVNDAGFFDNWGNLFVDNFMSLNDGGGTDVFGDVVVFGAAGNPNLSLALSGNLRIPFGLPASWLCFCETPGPAVYLGSNSSITCESERIWGHLTGAPVAAVSVVEGGQFFYNGGVAPPQLSGAAFLLDIAGTTFSASQLPVDAPPQGCMWDTNMPPTSTVVSSISNMLQLPGCVLLLDGNLGIHLTAGKVNEWDDQSLTVYNVTQAAAGNQPVYNAIDATYNNQATLSFLNADSTNLASVVSLALPQPCTWYVVGEETFATAAFVDGAQAIYGGPGSPRSLSLFAGSTFEGTQAVDTKCVMCAVFNSTRSVGFVDDWDPAHASPQAGDATTIGATPGTSAQGAVQIGGGVNTFFMTGKIALVAAFAGIHTASQRQQAMEYLGARFAIPVAP